MSETLPAALNDADILLNYAAGNGLLSDNLIGTVVPNLQLTRRALGENELSPHIAMDFWAAYANLAKLTKPITAESIRASSAVSLRGTKVTSIILTVAIIALSTLAFMNNAIVSYTLDLIAHQNNAAVQLVSGLQLLRSNASDAQAPTTANPPAAPGYLLTDASEFSRNSWLLLQTAKRLHFWFNPWWHDTTETLSDLDDKAGQLQVSPGISTKQELEQEVVRQVSTYQAIRGYAFSLLGADSLVWSITNYFLPAAYAVLGTFLYSLRLYSTLIRQGQYLPTDTRNGTRYLNSAIAGLIVGLFGVLLFQNLALPQLAVGFLIGYLIEPLFSRLDGLVGRLKSGTPVAQQLESLPFESRLSREQETDAPDIDNVARVADYESLMSRAAEVYSGLTFMQAIRIFPRQPLYFSVASLGILAGRYAGIVGVALAEPNTFTPPLGLSQGTFSGIVVLFAALFTVLVVGLFWAGYVAKPKSAAAAAVVQHLVTFLSGALLGLKV